MTTLGWLTLGYAAVLVVALAVSLTAIGLHLRGIGSVLGEVGEALERARRHTEPLEEPIRVLDDAAAEMAGEFEDAADRLREADHSLGARSGRSDVDRQAG